MGTEKQMHLLKTTTVAFQSREDELVSNLTLRVLGRYPGIETRVLEGSTHFFYAEEDVELLKEEFCRRFR